MKKSRGRPASFTCIICCKPSTTNTHRSEMLADNFPIIFLLRKLIPLPVSSSFCEDLLKENGHPSSWFSFCGSCLMIVMKAQLVYSQMAQLQAEFKNLQSTVKKRILKSFEGSSNTDDRSPNRVLGCREKVRKTIGKKCGLMLNTSTENEYGQRNFERETENNSSATGDESYFTIKSYGTLCTDSHGRISIKPPPEPKKNDSDEEMPPALIYYGKPRQCSSKEVASHVLNNKRARRNIRTTKKTDMSYFSEDDSEIKKSPKGKRKRKVWNIRKNAAKVTSTAKTSNDAKAKRGLKIKTKKTLVRPKKPAVVTERKLTPGRAETICPICHLKLTVLQLSAHIRNTHKDAGKTFKCDKCGRGFFTSYERRIHIRRVHTGEKPYKCMDCGKAYVDVTGLGRHRNKYGENANGIPKCRKAVPDTPNDD